MELTAKHHRQVHYLLLLINIIGLTLLSIAIVVTYLNQPSTTVVKTPPVCPTFEPTKFHLDSSGFFTNAPYIVEILDDEHDGTIECIGVLINQNSVLTSRRCFDKVLDEASKERSMRPSARHRKITTGETVTILVVEKKYPKTYRPDTAFHDNLVMLHLALPFDDVVTFVNLKDDYGSGECNNLETHNLTLVEYHPIWSQRVVTVVEQTDCKAAWPDKEISDNEFCVIDKKNREPCKYILGGLLFESVRRPNSTVIEDVLVGVYSYHHDGGYDAKNCDEVKAVFTNVGKYVDWIRSTRKT